MIRARVAEALDPRLQMGHNPCPNHAPLSIDTMVGKKTLGKCLQVCKYGTSPASCWFEVALKTFRVTYSVGCKFIRPSSVGGQSLNQGPGSVWMQWDQGEKKKCSLHNQLQEFVLLCVLSSSMSLLYNQGIRHYPLFCSLRALFQAEK